MRSGRYRHYKGNEYIVIGVARHSETDEELIEVLTENKHVRIERIVSSGQASPDGYWCKADSDAA